MDMCAKKWPKMATLPCELCAGFNRFSDDIAMMIGHRPNYYWIVCWVAITPIMTWVISYTFLFFIGLIHSMIIINWSSAQLAGCVHELLIMHGDHDHCFSTLILVAWQ